MDQTIVMKPIGRVFSAAKELVDEHWGELACKVVLLPEYVGGLAGLEDFSHAIIVTHLHQAKYERDHHLQRRPRGLASMPWVGIFAQRAKDRPNALGITAVRIVRVTAEYLEVQGLDAVNDTPVLDIKPYYPAYDRMDEAKTPEWVKELMKGYF